MLLCYPAEPTLLLLWIHGGLISGFSLLINGGAGQRC